MRSSTVLSCDMCEHKEVCKIKDDYQKFTMNTLPDFIAIDYACKYWTAQMKHENKKMPNYQGTGCNKCLHEKVCVNKVRVESCNIELEKLRQGEMFRNLAIRCDCRDFVYAKQSEASE